MSLDLKATRKEFELTDESGYRFKVVAEQIQDGHRQGGWNASLQIDSAGMATDHAAVTMLGTAATIFARMLKEAGYGKS